MDAAFGFVRFLGLMLVVLGIAALTVVLYDSWKERHK
jgi:hypothetical protein